MAEKLKLLFLNLSLPSRLSLFLKSFVFGFFLWWAIQSDFRIIPLLIFLSVAFYLYIRSPFESYYTWKAFFALLVISLWGGAMAGASPAATVLLVLASSLVFYLLLGIKDYLFIKRSRWYYVATLLLLCVLFLIFFISDKSEYFFLKYGVAVLMIFLLFREWLTIIPSFHFPRRELASALVFTFLFAQIIWALALLPIGFLGAANFALLFTFIGGDILLKHFTGGLSKEFLIQRSAFFILLVMLIFWTSSWTLVL